jgi:hypothetical protein
LDALSSSQGGEDPLNHWGEIIIKILKTDVPSKTRDKILEQGKLVASAVNDFTMTIMSGLDGRPLSTEDALSLPGLHDQGVRYAVLRIIKVLTPAKELITELSYRAYGLNAQAPPFPQMQEFLSWMWDDRQYVLRKKKWP